MCNFHCDIQYLLARSTKASSRRIDLYPLSWILIFIYSLGDILIRYILLKILFKRESSQVNTNQLKVNIRTMLVKNTNFLNALPMVVFLLSLLNVDIENFHWRTVMQTRKRRS